MLRSIASKVSAVTVKNNCVIKRLIMMNSSRAEKAVAELKVNPYFDKYAEKIAKLQQTSPEEFLTRIESHESDKKRKEEESKAKERQFSNTLTPKSKISERNINKESLDKIMKVDAIKDKNSDEIKVIWEQYHIQKECTIVATVPKKTFLAMREKSVLHPTFIFPLPRSQGYEFILCQFEGNSVHFTPLLSYQVHKENAPECLTIKHYVDLMDEKEIVLMKGEFDKHVLDAKEALCLTNQMQIYYCQNQEEKNSLLENFTKKPDEFKHADLIKQIENLTL